MRHGALDCWRVLCRNEDAAKIAKVLYHETIEEGGSFPAVSASFSKVGCAHHVAPTATVTSWPNLDFVLFCFKTSSVWVCGTILATWSRENIICGIGNQS